MSVPGLLLPSVGELLRHLRAHAEEKGTSVTEMLEESERERSRDAASGSRTGGRSGVQQGAQQSVEEMSVPDLSLASAGELLRHLRAHAEEKGTSVTEMLEESEREHSREAASGSRTGGRSGVRQGARRLRPPASLSPSPVCRRKARIQPASEERRPASPSSEGSVVPDTQVFPRSGAESMVASQLTQVEGDVGRRALPGGGAPSAVSGRPLCLNFAGTMETNAIEIPALGRPFSLGMLYDCRTDKLIPGVTLWNHDALSANVASRSQENTSFELISSDSVTDKASALNITAPLKASFLSGLVSVGGSATYINDTKKSSRLARVTLKYARTTRFDQLTMDHLGTQNMTYPEVFERGMATHVVTGILYGAQAFFIFDHEVSTSEKLQDIQGRLSVMIKKIPSITIEGEGKLTMTDKDKERVAQFNCTFHGDFALDRNPVTYEDAINIYARLPSLLGPNGDRAVPVKVWLYPLNELDNRAARLVREISDNLVCQAENVIQEMTEVNMKCNDLMKLPVAEIFPDVKRKIRQFREYCEQFTNVFQKQLAQTLPSIRGGGMEEVALSNILIGKDKSPFARIHIDGYLSTKKQELDFVNSYMKVLAHVKVLPAENELNEVVSDPTVEFIVCYNFTSLNEQETFLSDLTNWLQILENLKNEVYQPNKITPWFKNADIIQKARRYVQVFQEFTQANTSREDTQYIISCTPDSNNPGVSIYLYEAGGLACNKFLPPAKPSPPGIMSKSHDTMKLSLKPSDFGEEFLVGYSIEYKNSEKEKWNVYRTESKDQEVNIQRLQANKTYQFRYSSICKAGLSAVSNITVEKTLPDHRTSTPSDEITALTSEIQSSEVKYRLLKESNLVEQGSPSIYELKTELSESVYRKYRLGKENPAITKKVMLLVGATGTGKTTLINGIANYVLGVDWKDDFRFKLIHEVTNQSQAHSQTAVVTAYEMNYETGFNIPYSLTLIDTPGFGDTRGIEQDKKVTEAIFAFFSSNKAIDQIDAVCFVVQASLARLTHTQKYIFNSVFSIFGKDIKDNILVLDNFSDGERPPVLEAIKTANIPCTLDSNGDPKHFKFNNSALFADNQSRAMSVNEMIWAMGAENMKRFFTSLNTIQTRSLKLTVEILRERKELEVTLQALQPQIKAGLTKLEAIRKTKASLEQNKSLMEANKNFDYEIDVIVPVQEAIPHGQFITNCQKCHFTCHDNCAYANDKDKIDCSAMKNGFCTVCPEHCVWNIHYNQKYSWKYVNKKEKRTYDELKKKFEEARGEVTTVQKMFQVLNDEYSAVKKVVLQLINKSSKSLKRLQEIALTPNPLTTTEYIDLMIQSEKQEGKEGFLERTKSLQEVREIAEITEKIDKNEELLPDQIQGPSRLAKRIKDKVEDTKNVLSSFFTFC